ncbi:hypothetical protein AFLA_004271 [Aspergillus flavus NRRL3357]|nr:hypothetical protein AFLA_004271 [Aspergillus flavus NRRL3357]
MLFLTAVSSLVPRVFGGETSVVSPSHGEDIRLSPLAEKLKGREKATWGPGQILLGISNGVHRISTRAA